MLQDALVAALKVVCVCVCVRERETERDKESVHETCNEMLQDVH